MNEAVVMTRTAAAPSNTVATAILELLLLMLKLVLNGQTAVIILNHALEMILVHHHSAIIMWLFNGVVGEWGGEVLRVGDKR